MSLGPSTFRRLAGAAIAGTAVALGVFTLLGLAISPRFAVVLKGEVVDRVLGFYHVIICPDGRVPVRGVVAARLPDQSVVPIRRARLGREETSEGGVFDFQAWPHSSLIVSAPGCEPQALRVRNRNRHDPYRVTLDCPRRIIGSPPTPPLSVDAL